MSPADASLRTLIGRSPPMQHLLAEAARLAEGDESLLVIGEAGTGKHALARAIHGASRRATGPFVTLDCAEIGPEALERELFGALDGERPARPGALELARGGSLLLDELSELPWTLQQRLERALTQRRYQRVGGGPELALELRVIAASRRKLSTEVARERFLPALAARFERALTVPPLRERRDDIPLLAQHFLGGRADGEQRSLSRAALELLTAHDWPGNVRELRNVVERGLAAPRGGGEARLLAALLFEGEPPPERRPSMAAEPPEFEPGLSYREERARFEAAFERRYVAWLLERHDGNVSAAARAAEMDRKYLYKLARKHALKSAT